MTLDNLKIGQIRTTDEKSEYLYLILKIDYANQWILVYVFPRKNVPQFLDWWHMNACLKDKLVAE